MKTMSQVARLADAPETLEEAQIVIERLDQERRALRADKARLDWLEEWHLSLSRLTAPDMSGLRFVGQAFNPAKMRGEAGSAYIRVQGQTIRAAVDAAMKSRD